MMEAKLQLKTKDVGVGRSQVGEVTRRSTVKEGKTDADFSSCLQLSSRVPNPPQLFLV